MFVEKFAFTSPDRYCITSTIYCQFIPFLVCALDIAAWDLYGKMHKRPLFSFWSKGDEPMPLCDYTYWH
jgi:L-alanine-DL-glutamate epimerase-like enolase superfamily enzyme